MYETTWIENFHTEGFGLICGPIVLPPVYQELSCLDFFLQRKLIALLYNAPKVSAEKFEPDFLSLKGRYMPDVFMQEAKTLMLFSRYIFYFAY